MTDPGTAMTATYNGWLVGLSFLIVIIAAYTALNLAGRVTAARGRVRQLWLAGGAIAMGVGIWSMHFIGMLAYKLPVSTTYDLLTVLVSMAVAVIASGAALFVVSRQQMGHLALLAGGTFMGLGIAAMHYTGMVAMRLESIAEYDPKLVALSIVIAIAASLVALWLVFHLRAETRGLRTLSRKLVSALMMGSAIAGMHYTAMAAVQFQPRFASVSAARLSLESLQRVDNTLLAAGVGVATLVLLALVLLASCIDQRISAETARAEALRQSEERFRSLVQNASSIIGVVAADGSMDYVSPSSQRILGYEPEDWLGKKAFAYCHPDDLAKATTLWTDALASPALNFRAELRLRHAAGEWRSFEVIANNLLAEPSVNGIVTTYRDITQRKQADEALRLQTERERLGAEMAQRIRQSLNLEEILSNTVSEVRHFLHSDRVFIYRFEPDWSGTVIVESVDPAWPAILGKTIKDSFFEHSSGRQLYQQGRIQAIEDVYAAGLSPCHLDLLVQLQVRASLVVPILQEEQLWGLLVANQCSGPRQWQQLEINLLQQLETQVAIAIQQSELYQQAQADISKRQQAEEALRRVNEELELRVAQRTTALSSVNQQLLVEISDRKQAEAALKESQRRLNSLIDALPGIVFSCRNDQKWSMRYLSEGCLALTGYKPQELLGHGVASASYNVITHSEDLPQILQSINRAIAVNQPYVVEYRIHTQSGEEKWLWEKGSGVLDEQGEVLGLEGFITDITQLKQAQKALQEAHDELEIRVQARTVELATANKELEAFSYSVSHDLRAPLRAMNGFSRILLKEYAPQLPPQASRYLQMVQDNAQQMGHLVDDLLTFSRLARSLLKKQPVTPNLVVQQALNDLRHEQQGRQIDLAIAELPICDADPALLKQVWINLLANALKFTRQRQQAQIEIGYQPGPTYFSGAATEPVYFIKDNGVGFDMRYAHKLFGVFQRLHRAEEYEGTGVGLAIVQRIVRRHGGRVWAEAAINGGATFYFTLGGGTS